MRKITFNNLRIIFIIIFSYIFFGTLNLISKDKYCYGNSEKKICKLTKLISKPSEFMLYGLKETNRLNTNKNTSGLVVKNIESTEKRFKDLN